jgi:excisionase family DNA binding protein
LVTWSPLVVAVSTPLTFELSGEQFERLVEAVARALEARERHSSAKQVNGSPWLRGADQIATYIGSPRSRVYALASAGRIPVQRDGSALLADKAELDAWLRAGGGRRP